MITLVYGGMNSGKSKYAEDIIRKEYSELPGYYVATMIPYGEFGEEKIAKHRAMREDLGLTTIEDPYLEKIDTIDGGYVILMEDLSNLIANYIFERDEDYKGAINRLIQLSENNELIIVALKLDENDSSQKYDEQTVRYIKEMNEAIAMISSKADRVVDVNEVY